MIQKLIILGLLQGGCKHGYEIKKFIKKELGLFTSVDTLSIYYPLKVMEREGLIKKEKQDFKDAFLDNRGIIVLTRENQKQVINYIKNILTENLLLCESEKALPWNKDFMFAYYSVLKRLNFPYEGHLVFNDVKADIVRFLRDLKQQDFKIANRKKEEKKEFPIIKCNEEKIKKISKSKEITITDDYTAYWIENKNLGEVVVEENGFRVFFY